MKEDRKLLKGLGHEIKTRLVVWFDRSFLEESPADIHNFDNIVFHFILNQKFLAV
jgi:hypothetical protein